MHRIDGKTVIGIQIENEYTGPIQHLLTLRKLAEEIGYKAPFFTMTAWPLSKPDNRLLPLAGGYPDGPWNGGKKELKPNNRFAITPARTEDEIGGDLFKSQKAESGVFDYIPYGTCETGPGNQVTQHRRPFISEKDGYGVSFAKFASGMNWICYYMFCGGANPNDRLLQESKLITTSKHLSADTALAVRTATDFVLCTCLSAILTPKYPQSRHIFQNGTAQTQMIFRS